MARAAVDVDDWDRWWIAINQGLTDAADDVEWLIGEIFRDSLFIWRTLAIPNGNDSDSLQISSKINQIQC